MAAKQASSQQIASGKVQQLTLIELENPLMNRPQFFTNHYTFGKDIVVQDINNELYLIAANGKVLWKKSMGKPIIGEIAEVDILRNGKNNLPLQQRMNYM